MQYLNNGIWAAKPALGIPDSSQKNMVIRRDPTERLFTSH